jgi:hypothetical protein
VSDTEAAWSEWRGTNLPVTDWTEVLRRNLTVRIVRDDGTEDDVGPEIGTDGRWSYLVPDGVQMVAGFSVAPGDTISGEIAW